MPAFVTKFVSRAWRCRCQGGERRTRSRVIRDHHRRIRRKAKQDINTCLDFDAMILDDGLYAVYTAWEVF